MFWGLIIQQDKKYTSKVCNSFHVSQAVLDITDQPENTDVSLILTANKINYTLCVLNKSGTVQVPLNLLFTKGDTISFRSVGGTVHLSGYLVNEFEDESSDDTDR